MRIRFWMGFIGGAVLLGGCGGSSGPSGLKVRAVNAVTGLGLANVSVASTVVMTSGSYGSFGGYVSCNPGAADALVLSNATGNTLFQNTATLANNSFYTVYAINSAASPNLIALLEDHSSPGSNVRMNVVDLAPSLAGVDVYITAPGATLTTPSFTNIAFMGAQTVAMPAAQYEIRFTVTGTTTVVGDYTSGALPGGAMPRYLLIDAPTGGSPQNVVAMTDGGQ
jgi:uncharacterized protein DUF4397